MKLQLIFNTQSECDEYFGEGGIPSKYLVIIKEYELPTGEVVTNSLLSSTNNISVDSGDVPVVIETGESAMSYSYSVSYSYVLVDEDYEQGVQLSYDILTSSPTPNSEVVEVVTGQ